MSTKKIVKTKERSLKFITDEYNDKISQKNIKSYDFEIGYKLLNNKINLDDKIYEIAKKYKLKDNHASNSGFLPINKTSTRNILFSLKYTEANGKKLLKLIKELKSPFLITILSLNYTNNKIKDELNNTIFKFINLFYKTKNFKRNSDWLKVSKIDREIVLECDKKFLLK